MRKVFLLAIFSLVLLTGTAMGETLQGRFGIYGKGGAIVPLQSDFVSGSSGTSAGAATGGGLIFGVTKNWAIELDVTYAPRFDVDFNGSKSFDATYTDVALGAQYRFASQNRVVPYVGFGADFIRGRLKFVGSGPGSDHTLDWTEGGHINLGFDYFITRGIVFTIDTRGIAAIEGDIKGTNGHWHPLSFVGTAGIRLMLPEVSSW